MAQYPALEVDPNQRKSLPRMRNRAGLVAEYNKIVTPAQSAVHLRKAQFLLYKRVMALAQPVERIIGKGDNQRVVLIHDDDALCQCARTLCQVIEQRRVILRIPGPGRDSAAEQRTINVPSAPTLDVEGIMREAAGAMGTMPDAATAPTSDPASASSPSTP